MNHKIIASDDELKAIALAVARNRVGPRDPVEDVLAAEGVPPNEFGRLLDDPVFQRYVKKFTRELTDTGMSFKLKTRVLVEDTVAHLYEIIVDREQPAVARIKAFETLAKYGGYDEEIAAEYKKAQQGTTESQPAFQITFNIPSAVAPVVQTTSPTSATVDIVPLQVSFSDIDDADAYEDAEIVE